MANPDQVFVEIEVEGDGNCFYRSLYKAAKYHPDASVFGRVLACFGIELGAANASAANASAANASAANAASNSNSSSAGKGKRISKSKAKTKKARAKAKSDEAEEDAFCTAIRHALAERFVDTDILDGTFDTWTEAAHAALGGQGKTWKESIDAAADEIAEAFENPAIFISTSADDFKEQLAAIVRQEGVYASQIDYDAVKTILASCGIILMSAEGRPRRAANISNLRTADADGSPVLMVRRMKKLDHYRAYITEEQFKAHKDEISPKPKSSVPKVSVAKFRKTMKAPKAQAAAAAAISMEAPIGASSSENSNYEAALAASLKNM
jgi:hypothetical protein